MEGAGAGIATVALAVAVSEFCSGSRAITVAVLVNVDSPAQMTDTAVITHSKKAPGAITCPTRAEQAGESGTLSSVSEVIVTVSTPEFVIRSV